jgi:hypothetical protein
MSITIVNHLSEQTAYQLKLDFYAASNQEFFISQAKKPDALKRAKEDVERVKKSLARATAAGKDITKPQEQVLLAEFEVYNLERNPYLLGPSKSRNLVEVPVHFVQVGNVFFTIYKANSSSYNEIIISNKDRYGKFVILSGRHGNVKNHIDDKFQFDKQAVSQFTEDDKINVDGIIKSLPELEGRISVVDAITDLVSIGGDEVKLNTVSTLNRYIDQQSQYGNCVIVAWCYSLFCKIVTEEDMGTAAYLDTVISAEDRAEVHPRDIEAIENLSERPFLNKTIRQIVTESWSVLSIRNDAPRFSRI